MHNRSLQSGGFEASTTWKWVKFNQDISPRDTSLKGVVVGASSPWTGVGCDKEPRVLTELPSMPGQHLIAATVGATLAGPTSYTDVRKACLINQAEAEGDEDASEDDPETDACCTPTPEGLAITGWQPELEVSWTGKEAQARTTRISSLMHRRAVGECLI